MKIRARQVTDLEQLEDVARRIQASDRYPIYLPDGDFRRFLTQPASVAAWVAVAKGRVVGHVALNASTSDPVMQVVEQPR